MFLSLKNPTFGGRREVYLAQNKQENFLEIGNSSQNIILLPTNVFLAPNFLKRA